MESKARTFLWTVLLAFVALATVVAVFNRIVDPYLVVGTPRIVGFNAHKSTAVDNMALIKAYDVFRTQPRALILGSSRVGSGLDPENPAWPQVDRPVYDLGLPWGDPHAAYRYLQNATASHAVSLVVLGLEFQSFMIPANPELEQETEAHLMLTRTGARRADERQVRIKDFLLTTFSFSTLSDSLTTLLGNLKGNSTDVVRGSWNPVDYQQYIARAGSYTVFSEVDLYYFSWYSRKWLNTDAMQDVTSIVEWCHEHDIRLILLINPSHADELEMLDLVGAWGLLENWKRKLLALTRRYRTPADHSKIELWDFCEYDTYSTEPLRRDNHRLTWFLDNSHYNKSLGNKIVARIFGGEKEDFGSLLTPENIESRLREIRERRRQYRKAQPEEAARVRNIYETSVRWQKY